MFDQAQGLRALADEARRVCELDRSVVASPRIARTIAVTSGKGGVGKTSVCVNLALLLANAGKRVCLFDADLGLANIHVMLGISPEFRMEHVIRGEKRLRDILYPGPEGVSILSGGSGVVELANLEEQQAHGLIEGLLELDSLADVILIDTGAGLSRNVLAFALAAEEVIVVTTPEPTALADAYATIKVVSHDNPDAHIRLLVNMAANAADARAASERLTLVARQFLNIDLDTLGYLPLDPAVARAVRAQKPFMLASPHAPASRALARIADTLAGKAHRPRGARALISRMAQYLTVHERKI